MTRPCPVRLDSAAQPAGALGIRRADAVRGVYLVADLEKILTIRADADLELMRASMRLAADPAAAAQTAVAILARIPGHEGATLLLSNACRRIGDPSKALAVLEPLAAAHPSSTVMQLELGRALASAGHDPQAEDALRRALALDSGLADAWQELAAIRFRGGDELGGDAAYLEYVKLAASPPELADAESALADDRLDTAETLLTQHLAQSPRDAVAMRMLGEVGTRSGNVIMAERHLRDCLRIAPGYSSARYDLACALHVQQRTDEVLELLQRLLVAESANVAYLALKAQTLRLIGRTEEALALMQGIVDANPGDVSMWLIFGDLLRETGEQAGAVAAYRCSLSLDPSSGEAYWSLANLKTFRFGAEDLTSLSDLVARSPRLGPNRVRLEFALGKALEDACDYGDSFRHYQIGNNLVRGSMAYAPDAVTTGVRRSEDMYTPRFFAERAGWGVGQRSPVFIVGLPRSGSTLLEQILASHPDVEGTRELADMLHIVRDLAARSSASDTSAYPKVVGSLGRAEVDALAHRYLAQTRAHRVLGKTYFVDKMLTNFGHLGLIHLMFPNAPIIDARRHPLACGFSCFKQLFSQGSIFSYNLAEIGRYYRDYHELMAHMDAVLPGRVHRVHYEQLVADPEAEVRRLLDYCGLPFNKQCLRFHESKRAVMTASSEQVRTPIYTDGVNQWRHFEPWLGPLAEPLGDLVKDYPTFGTSAA